MKGIIENQCKKSIIAFKDKAMNIPWIQRSILMSEGFAFCVMGDLFNIDTILESGVYGGRSTQIWAEYFSQDQLIIAVDRNKLNEETRERLGRYSNIELIVGNGVVELNKKIKELQNRRIGIFLDGPKGKEAVEFAKEALSNSSVYFIGIHDQHKETNGVPNERRQLFETWEKAQFFTDEKWFVDEYAWLDMNESQRDATQKITWYPGMAKGDSGKPDRIYASYGPTIGFAFNWEKK